MQTSDKCNVREYSYEILLGVFYSGELLNEAINKCFKTNYLRDIDKAYIKNECTGIIEKCDELDDIICKYLRNKNKKLEKELQVVLRLGCYELLYLDRVPSFASINECVNIIKNTRFKSLSGFVNAILRNVNRNLGNKKNYNNMNKSVPKRCYFRICNGKELDVINEFTEKNISYNIYEGLLDFKYAKVYYTNSYKDILATSCFKNGCIMISDASSIYLTDKLADFIKTRIDSTANKNISILDVCAAPGGKILGLVDLIHSDFNELHAEARDVSDAKINKIRENVDRLKVSNLKLCLRDASIYNEFDKEKYDVIICDVPCTGLGAVGKKPDIKIHYTKDKLNSLVILQKRILETSSKYLKPKGIISYSTCTTTYEENEDVINEFLQSNMDFIKIFEKRIEINDGNKADGFYICFLLKN